MQFYYQNYLIKIKYKNNKNIYFRLNNDLSIGVTCSSNIDIDKIKQYLTLYINKLEKKYAMDEYLNVKYDLNEGYLYFLGEKYDYQVSIGKSNYIKKNDNYLNIVIKDETRLKEVIDEYLLKEAKKYLEVRFSEIFEKFEHVDFDVELKISKMKSRFGVCYPKRKQITLSTQLIHFDDECINYVIIHELAHFVQPNHSKKFYYLIEQYLPNYKLIEKKIKKIKMVY